MRGNGHATLLASPRPRVGGRAQASRGSATAPASSRDTGRRTPELTVDCETFAKAVDRVSTISSERGRAVKVQPSLQNVLDIHPGLGRRSRTKTKTKLARC